MGYIGLSLIVASVVYVIIRPPAWLPPTLLSFLQRTTATTVADVHNQRRDKKDTAALRKKIPPPLVPPTINGPDSADRAAKPSPPLPRLSVPQDQPPSPPAITLNESPTTPKATAPAFRAQGSMPPPPPPTFSLTATDLMPPPPRPTTTSRSPAAPSPSSVSSMMPPPPVPRLAPGPRPPTLGQFPAAHSAQRARGPAPNRERPSSLAPASSGGSGLAPPPTHTSIPSKPSRQVVLEPGHSPLDWARISGPNADLRGLASSTPYLRVTPSMLKRQTGRKGKDGWMALNGKVYNVTPYAKFHPGGVPELMRGAGRDGTRLFGEVHPWVNYENMLTACLIGIMVDEPETGTGQVRSEMEEMD